MKNKQTLPQQETAKQSPVKSKFNTRSRGVAGASSQQSSVNNSKKTQKIISQEIDIEQQDEQDLDADKKQGSLQTTPVIHDKIKLAQHLSGTSHSLRNKQSLDSFQSPQILLNENKELPNECQSTKMRRGLRNTTDSKSISSSKTTPLIASPSKLGPNNKRNHPHHESHLIQQSEEEMEEPCLRKKIQQSFMANSQKIEELDNEIRQEDKQIAQQIEESGDEGQNNRQEQQLQSKGVQNHRHHLKHRDQVTPSKNKHMQNAHSDLKSQESQANEMEQEDHQSFPSRQLPQQYEDLQQQLSDEGNQGASLPEQDTEPRQSRIRIQKINFGGFSDSDDLTGPDSSSQNNSNMNNAANHKISQKKQIGKSVTLIFSRKPGKAHNNYEDQNNKMFDPETAHAMSLREEIEGQQEQSIQSGNLFISICNTDEHYPPLFNQKYLEDNISLIQKRQCHMRQKRRMLQLDSINSISIDKDNRLYNLLDERVIKEQNQGSIQVLNGIVEYEQSLRPQPVTKQKVKCNCKKTKCLKLYCDCFNQGVFCSPDCNCTECYNIADRKEERENAIILLKGRNPDAFKPKIQTKEDDDEVLMHNKGCNCKKSGCEKKYCECYNTGVKCSSQCKCDGCRNRDPSNLIKNNNNNNSGGNLGSLSCSNPFLWNSQPKSSNEHDCEFIFQSSLALGSHHHLNHSLNHNRSGIGGPSSPEDALAPFKQSSKKFNMGEYNPDIPRQLNPGDISQGYQKNKFLGLSSFAFSQDEDNNHNNSNYLQGHHNNSQGHFLGGNNNNGIATKEEFFTDQGDKGNRIFGSQDNNATVVSFSNGQISVAKQEQ